MKRVSISADMVREGVTLPDGTHVALFSRDLQIPQQRHHGPSRKPDQAVDNPHTTFSNLSLYGCSNLPPETIAKWGVSITNAKEAPSVRQPLVKA